MSRPAQHSGPTLTWGAVEPLSDSAVDTALLDRRLQWGREGGEIVKVWSGKDFAQALAFVNAVGRVAEEANHHPDIDIRWNRVTLRLATHSVGGVTERDLDLAARVDALQI
jgi:4a-hydroxytetrahydrobiopterin dehydratase